MLYLWKIVWSDMKRFRVYQHCPSVPRAVRATSTRPCVDLAEGSVADRIVQERRVPPPSWASEPQPYTLADINYLFYADNIF